MEHSEGALPQRCAAEIDRLLARHHWRLLERAEFLRRTMAACAEVEQPDVKFVARGVYNLAMYEACAGSQGAERRELAYTELFRMLYERAWQHYPEIAEDAAQEALAQTIARFAACREPRAFVPFAFQQLMSAARMLRRRARPAESLERAVCEDGTPLGETIATPAILEDDVLASLDRAQIIALLERYQRQHPRAARQIDAVRLKYLAGLDDATISEELGVPVKSVYELRSRGLRRLREDGNWYGVWGDEA